MGTTGSVVIMVTVSPLCGCVTRKTTAWIGVTRPSATLKKRRRLLLLQSARPLVLALTSGVGMVFACQYPGFVTVKMTVKMEMTKTPSCVGRRMSAQNIPVALELVYHTG